MTILATTAGLVLQGVLLGGLYALFALGLSLTVGVLRFVNIAHGDLIVLVSFLILAMTTAFGIHVLLALAVVAPMAFMGGFLLQRLLLQRVVGQSPLLPLLVTFGLAIIIQNGLFEGFGADTRLLPAAALQTASFAVGPVRIGVLPLLSFIVAALLILLLDLLLYRTRLGASIRAVSDDVEAADLIGLAPARICAIAMGVVGVSIAVAACFMGLRTSFDPTSGPNRLLVAFECVVLGGLGSLWGTLAGGVIIGIAQSVGAQFDAGWQALAGHLVFLSIFLLRPQGLFPKYQEGL